MDGEVTIERRFRGPAESGNGGYACGVLARFLDAEGVEVTLRQPPPLDRELAVEASDGRAAMHDGDALVAEAEARGDFELELPEPVGGSPLRNDHPFDCPGGIAAMLVPEVGVAVLGRMTARLDGPIEPGMSCVAMGWPIERDGRKLQVGSAIFSEGGEPLARVRATWIELRG